MTDAWDGIRETLDNGTEKAKEKAVDTAYNTAALGSIGVGGVGGLLGGAGAGVKGMEVAESVNTGNPEVDMAARGAIYAGSAGLGTGIALTGLASARKGLNWVSDRYSEDRNVLEYAGDRTGDVGESAENFYQEAREEGLSSMAADAVTEPDEKVVINDFATVRDPLNGTNTIVLDQDDMYGFLSDRMEEDEAEIATELYSQFGGFITDPADRIVQMEVNGEDITEEYRESRSQPVLALKTEGRNYQIPVGPDEIEELTQQDQSRFTRGIVDEIGETTGLNRLRKTENYPSINQAEELIRQLER